MDHAEDMETIRVLAAVIRRGNLILLCKRPAHKRHGGLWEFPGGKLEKGESLFDAARRELVEELGIMPLSVGETLFVCTDPGSPFVIEFVDVVATSEPTLREHEELRWVEIGDAATMNLAPADEAFVAIVLRSNS